MHELVLHLWTRGEVVEGGPVCVHDHGAEPVVEIDHLHQDAIAELALRIQDHVATNRVNGHKIEITAVDDGTDPAKAVTAAKDLIGRGYKIIGGSTSSGVALQIAVRHPDRGRERPMRLVRTCRRPRPDTLNM